MKTVNVHQASTAFSALLSEVERGETVTIARNGTPVAVLVRVAQPNQRQPGILAEQPGWRDFRYDRSLFVPMTEEEQAAEGWP